MFTKIASVAAVALAASTLVSAQTFTNCNPTEKTCPADAAVGKNSIDCDLSSGLCNGFTEADGTTLTFGDKGAVFSIEKESNAPTVSLGKFIFFGRVDVVVQAALGTGIVTSSVLQSDDLDEIDWEWVGGDDTQVQTNYFSKGDTSTYDRGGYSPVANPLTTFHTYTIDWTPAAVNWIIDGVTVRTLTYEEAGNGAKFPQTPMEVKLGTWCAGGKNTPVGTVEWAGGYTNFADAPFNAYYKSISIVDYAGGNGPTDKSVKEYIYGDKTGTYESIKVVTGDSSDDDDATTTTKATSTKATSTKVTSTKTKEPETTKTTEAETTTKTKTKEHTTTTEAATTTTTKVKTTSTTSTTSFSMTPSTTPTTTSSEDAPTTTDAPATQPTDAGDDATRGAAALGGVALAGALVLAQLL